MKRAAGTPEDLPSSTAICTSEKSADALSSPRVRLDLRHPAARVAFRPFAPTTRDGLRPASPDPRRTNQTILRWRTFSTSTERVGTRPLRSRQERSCDARQARRNQTTSAAANRVRYALPAATAPDPRIEHAARRAPSRIETARTIRPLARGGDRISARFRECIVAKEESAVRRKSISPFSASCGAARMLHRSPIIPK